MMMQEDAVGKSLAGHLPNAPANAGGGSTAPQTPSPNASKESATATTKHQSETEAKSPAAIFLEYVFTSSFFEQVWEKAPFVVPHNTIRCNPFLSHRWITEEDMICMCYRAAVAGTLKIFRRGVAYPPPNVPVPGPLPHEHPQQDSRKFPAAVSQNLPGVREGSCDEKEKDDASVNEPVRSDTSKSPLRRDCHSLTRATATQIRDKGPSESDRAHASKESAEPGSSWYLACVGPYLDGCSLVLNQADRTHPGLQELCRTLAERFFTHVFAVAYLTPPASYAVDIHTDDQDVFLIHLWGQKHWKVYAPPQELPLSEEMLGKKEPFNKDAGEPLLQLTLEEGDILYIPRGFPHEALTTNQNSLHITVTVPTAEYAYINALTRFLRSLVLDHKVGPATEKYCRASLLPKMETNSAQPSEAGTRRRKATEELMSLLNYEDVVDVLQSHLARINAMQTAQFRKLQAIPATPLVTQSSLVRLVPGIQCTCEEGSAEASFFRSGQSMKMKIRPSASTTIHQLATTPTLVEVAKLQCSDCFERLCVLLVLHKKGLIDVVGESVMVEATPCAREVDVPVQLLQTLSLS